MKYYSTIKKNEIMLSAATWIDLEIILSDSERQICDKTYMWTLKYETDELIYKTETDSYREQNCGYKGGRVGGRGKD